MNQSVEERLERAGRTLDAASSAYEARVAPGSDATAVLRVASPSRHAALCLAGVSAILVAVVVTGVVLVGTGGSDSTPRPATAVRGSVDEITEAVAATRAASAMSVDIRGTWERAPDGAESVWNYGAPDRWEQLEQPATARLESSPPAGITTRLYVGNDTWVVVDGRWVQELPAHPDAPAPVALLNRIASANCASHFEGQLVGWTVPSGDCGTAPDEVWFITLDESGRISAVRYGERIELDAAGSIPADPSSGRVLGQPGDLGDVTAQFWYDNVPEVSGRPAE